MPVDAAFVEDDDVPVGVEDDADAPVGEDEDTLTRVPPDVIVSPYFLMWTIILLTCPSLEAVADPEAEAEP